MPVASYLFAHAHPVTQHYIDREEHKKYLFLPLFGNTEDLFMTVHAPTIDESQ